MVNFIKPYFFILMVNCTFITAQQPLERISVDGNNFVTEDGKTIVFSGLSSSDPDKLEKDGLWSKSYFQEIKRWGANLVRFPVHPARVRERGKKEYLQLLDEGIRWAGEEGLYVIMDWHSIGNLKTGIYLADMYDTDMKETFNFWRNIAVRYGENPVVAFYELYNEPTTFNNRFGTVTWEEWKKINKEIITILRANGGKGIPLVAGFNWAYDLTPVKFSPLDVEGIGYVSHPYPQKREKPWEEKWTADWGFVKNNYPVILTEMGFSGPEDPGAHVPVISDESYGDAITEYCDERGISYVVWVFDKQWAPRLYTDDSYTPSRQGKYFKKKLQSYDKGNK
ncbi:glycoside hydrolase family 5 protein [Muricauda sp. CAU 1633]|uniref:glycoside hydrolase family 5 protein n=1 Tax=Allomuricauda sp. CAU 1633 TaxID=2816036 RepID=UPI001A8C88E4|nr:cellulase family glycosylhydrolase [Muricauda sp. CAU 1633]MBO0322219.1 glycoside hydrolase family 5 protein [Muricauda sp. CAU 1633]